MITDFTNYFTSISSQKRKHEDVSTSPEAPASNNKNKKRTSLNGFSKQNNPKRLDSIKKILQLVIGVK